MNFQSIRQGSLELQNLKYTLTKFLTTTPSFIAMHKSQFKWKSNFKQYQYQTYVFSPSKPGDKMTSSQNFNLNKKLSEYEGNTPSSGPGYVKKDVNLLDVMKPVKEDMEILNKNLKDVVGSRHPLLLTAAEQIFGAGGKKIRPMIVLLIARATILLNGKLDNITEKHRRLAEITEMIHTASLVHDDVLDDCNIRRGKDTVNSLYGTRIAVLVGDFLFAQSSWFLANLENIEVIKLISKVIADFANGEISQASALYNVETTLETYLDKSFYKTASLIAASCRCSAVFSDLDEEGKLAMYNYGKHLGLAFQVVDDILDFTQSTEQLGKPQGQDLSSGNLTAPVIFSIKHSNELKELIESEFVEDGSLERAIEIINSCGGISDAQELANKEALKAKAALTCLPDSSAKTSLFLMVDYVLKRLY